MLATCFLLFPKHMPFSSLVFALYSVKFSMQPLLFFLTICTFPSIDRGEGDLRLAWPKRSLIPSSLNLTRSGRPLLCSSSSWQNWLIVTPITCFLRYIFFSIYWWSALPPLRLLLTKIAALNAGIWFFPNIFFSQYIFFSDILVTTDHPSSLNFTSSAWPLVLLLTNVFYSRKSFH